MDDKRIHLGIIGLGNWSRQIFQAVDRLPDVKITQCYSRYPDTKKAFASEFDCAACEQYEHMTEDPQIDGIVVMSSNAAHEKDVTLAASRGKHILVTKPISTTIAAAKRMIDVCRQNEVILAVGHQTRREPALRKLKEILDSGELGGIGLVEANYSTPNGLKIEPGDWRYTEDECPGGSIDSNRNPRHRHPAIPSRAGPPGSQLAGQGRPKGRDTGDHGDASGIQSGLRGYLGSSYVSGFSHWIKVYGTKKNACFSELGGLTLTEDSWEEGQVHKNIAPPANVGAPMPAIVEEIAEFVRCIRTKEPPEVAGPGALHNLAVVLAAVQSDKLARPVEIASLLKE